MRFEVLTEDDIARIDRASMDILSTTGLSVLDSHARDMLGREGAQTSNASGKVRIPERLVRDAVEHAPAKFKLGARDDTRSVKLGDGRTHFTNSATGIRVLDHRTGKVRESTLSDIPTFARVADALPNIHFYGPTVVANDVRDETHFLRETVAAIENTSKHVSHESHGTELTRFFVRIAQILSGGEEELRKNPMVSAGGCPVSPLQFDRANTEAMLECAKAGMPYDVLSMAMGGGTAPITLAGELALVNAEVLAGVTMCQLTNPGTPVIYGSVASTMDMRTGILALGAPERAILNAAVVQMARHYGIPSVVGGMSTDAKLPGEQAMFEKTMTCLPLALAGADVIFGPSMLSSATTYSVEQMVIDDEVAGALARVCRGMKVDDDDLALELIEKVGPGGGFIGSRHTLKHLRSDVWLPVLADRNTADKWAAAGSKGMRENAEQKVVQILSEHSARPIEEEQRREIHRVLQAASHVG